MHVRRPLLDNLAPTARRIAGVGVWVLVLVVCLLLLLLLLASCQRSPERIVVVRECGRTWHMPASSSVGYRRAVRLDCEFLKPHHGRAQDVTIGL